MYLEGSERAQGTKYTGITFKTDNVLCDHHGVITDGITQDLEFRCKSETCQ